MVGGKKTNRQEKVLGNTEATAVRKEAGIKIKKSRHAESK